MIQEEVAFYDALSSHDTAEEVLGDEVLRAIAHELTKSIKENMSIDWNLRESARAKMRITVRRLLKKYGYPPDLQKKIGRASCRERVWITVGAGSEEKENAERGKT